MGYVRCPGLEFDCNRQPIHANKADYPRREYVQKGA